LLLVMTTLGTSDLDVFPLALGTNTFGWTVDERQGFSVLDAYAAAGGNFIDTADSYTAWAPGNSGGEAETIIGRWLTARGNRDQVVIATKVGMAPNARNLRPETVRSVAEDSLRRLQVDRIDLYYAHLDDPTTPLEDTLGTLDALVREGKVRYVAASNYSGTRLAEALAVADREGLARFVAFQPRYNLVEREPYESDLAGVVARERLAVVPYPALANGFLTGKYRPDGADVDSPRAQGARSFLDERGLAVLAALDEIAAAHETTVSAVALAWLAAQPNVVAPLASARNPEQLAELLPAATLKLSQEEIQRLSDASRTVGAARTT
jgi:aryl-alcohol dehydrogenase-like predicted oxidoreductase